MLLELSLTSAALDSASSGFHPGELAPPDDDAVVEWLASAEPLRRWVRLLRDGYPDSLLPPDELPELVLPQRLVGQVPRHALVGAVRCAVDGFDIVQAKAAEVAAARRGLTMERFLLQRALEVRARRLR